MPPRAAGAGKARNRPAASTESTPESSVKRMIQARVFKAAKILTRAHVRQIKAAMRPPFPSRRCEKNRRGSATRAPLAPADLVQPERLQARRARPTRSACQRPRVLGTKYVALRPRRRRRRPRAPPRPLRNWLAGSPGRARRVSLAGRNTQRRHGVLEHAGGEPAPAGMRRADAPCHRARRTAPAGSRRP